MDWKLVSSHVWIIALLSIIISLPIFFTLLLGHSITITSIRPTSIHNITYIRKGKHHHKITIASIRLKAHLPTSNEPYWGQFWVEDYRFTDDKCDISIAEIKATLWFFPMFFRYTAGPLVTVLLHDFRARVYNSMYTPIWMRQLRDDLVYTITNEPTIRLHDVKTRLVYCSLMGLTGSGEDSYLPLEKPGLGDELYDVKLQGKAQQWHIHNRTNDRMYTFNDLDVEIQQSLVKERPSKLVMVVHDAKWTKLPKLGDQRASILQYMLDTLLRTPSDLTELIKNPRSLINIDISRFDITYDHFRLQDSAIIEQGGIYVRKQYKASKVHGSLSDTGIDHFLQNIIDLIL